MQYSNQTHVPCMHSTPHTKACCKHAKLHTRTLAVWCNRICEGLSLHVTEGSGANLRGSGLPASPLSSAPPNYAVKVALHALHMPRSFAGPRNKLSMA